MLLRGNSIILSGLEKQISVMVSIVFGYWDGRPGMQFVYTLFMSVLKQQDWTGWDTI